ADAVAVESEPEGGFDHIDKAELSRRAASVPEHIRALAGVDEALAAAENASPPSPLLFSLNEVPVMSGVASVAPIESVDELLDAIAHAAEVVDGAMEIERIIDGVCRLVPPRDEGFARRAAPIVKRLWSGDKGGVGIDLMHGAPPALTKLVL